MADVVKAVKQRKTLICVECLERNESKTTKFESFYRARKIFGSVSRLGQLAARKSSARGANGVLTY